MQLIKYFLIVFGMAIIVAGTATWLTNKGLHNSHVDFYGTMYAASDADKKTNFAIIGSSRALVHLDTRIIDSVTGLRSYNYGLNAASIKTCFNTLKYVLQYQKHLKLVMLNIDFNIFDLSADPYKDAYYYPFENNLSGFLMYDTTNSRFVHKLKFFDISLYDDYTKYAAIDGWLRPQRRVEGSYNGYTPQNIFADFKFFTPNPLKKTKIKVNDSGFVQLNEIISLCRNKGVKLAFIIAPYYKECFPDLYFTDYFVLIQRVKETADKNDVIYLDYSSMPAVSDKKYFYNCNHMNINGSSIYTKSVADTISIYLKSEKYSE